MSTNGESNKESFFFKRLVSLVVHTTICYLLNNYDSNDLERENSFNKDG